MTYNHGLYIEQALKSVLYQETTFDFEVVIGDDFSTDNTMSILHIYKEKYPNKIKILSRPINGEYYIRRKVGSHITNFVDIISNCSGKYIAFLDGDDYWTDPLKLQKQVSFLENNPEYNICYHPVNVLYNGVIKNDWLTNQEVPQTSGIRELIKYGNFIHTPSVVIRNQSNIDFNSFILAPIGDYFYYILNTQDGGKIYRIDDTMAIYRYGTGLHTTNTIINRKYSWLFTIFLISKSVKKDLQDEFRRLLENQKSNIKGFYEEETLRKTEILARKLSFVQIMKLIYYKLLKIKLKKVRKHFQNAV